MVHFGNQLKHHRIPEWAPNYLDYEKLKKIINRILYYRAAKVETSKNIDLLELDKRKISKQLLDHQKALQERNSSLEEKRVINNKQIKSVEIKDTHISECPDQHTDKSLLKSNQEISNFVETSKEGKQGLQFNNSDISELKTNQNSDAEEYTVLEAHLAEERKVMELFRQEFLSNITKIEAFFIHVNSDIVARLKRLNDNFHYMNDQADHKKSGVEETENKENQNEDEHILNQSDYLKLEKHRKVSGSKDDINKRREKNDEAGFSTSWKRAYGEIYNKSSWLHGFCVINKIALNKIMKKFNKTFSKKLPYDTNNKQVEDFVKEVKKFHKDLEKQASECKFYHQTDDVINLRVDVIQAYAENFFEGNNDKAKESLEQRLKGGLPKEMKLISFHLGMLVMMVLFLVAISYLPSK